MDWQLYLLLVPGFATLFIFNYIPMYGILYSFQDYSPFKGFFSSEWVGFKHFQSFFSSYWFWPLLRNTLRISVTNLIFNFPSSIILALLLNELRNKYFKKTVQTVSYFPHFISNVVVIGMLAQFTSPSTGVINQFIKALGFDPINFMVRKEWFVPNYVITGIWQNIGWGSILYLAGLSAINPQMYEAAIVDGASRLQRVIHVSLPGIRNTIVIMLIFQIGSLMSVSFERILLMDNDMVREVSSVINLFVYRRGIQDRQYSFSTAVQLFQSMINIILLTGANYFSRKYSEASLW